MAAKTRLDLLNEVRRLIDDPMDSSWDVSVKLTKLQEAQEKFVIDTRCLLDTDTDSIVASQAQYDLPTDCFDINRVTVSGLVCTRTSKFDLDGLLFRSNWADDTIATPTQYYVDLDPNNKKLYLFPIPTVAVTNGLVMEYIKIPPEMTSDSDYPLDGHTLLYPYSEALVYLASVRLLEVAPSAQNISKISMYMTEYKKLVSDCIEYFRNMSDQKPMRMRGGRYFQGM